MWSFLIKVISSEPVSSVDGISVLRSFGDLPLAVLQKSFECWHPKPAGMRYTIPGFSSALASSDAISQALTDLVFATAFPSDSGSDVSSEHGLVVKTTFLGTDALDELRDACYVRCVRRSSESSQWLLTPEGVASLRLQDLQVICNSSPAA